MRKPRLDGYIVGLGVADNRADAREIALAEIVTQLSVDIKVSQSQYNEKRGSFTTSHYKQQIDSSSLPFELVGIEEIKSASQDQQAAVLMGIKKQRLINSLYRQVSNVNSLELPDAKAENRFIFALEHKSELLRIEKMTRVLEVLDGKKPELQSRLDELTHSHARVLRQASCRIIGRSVHKSIVGALNNALRCNGGNTLWVQPQLNWRYSGQNNLTFAQANLIIKFTRTVSPFNTLKEYGFVATASGTSKSMARDAAIKQLITFLNRPVHQWGSEQ